MLPSIKDIYDELNTFAPFDTAEEWDNVGILAGKPERKCSNVLIALDYCDGVLNECRDGKYDLIITHHPIMFRKIQNLSESDAVSSALCSLIRADVGLIASHTCLDRACCGTAQTLANLVGLIDAQPISGGFGRVGTIKETSCLAFAEKCGVFLNTKPQLYTRANDRISKCAVCPGSGGSFWRDALNAGAQVYITGEAGHHDIMDALENGLSLITAGHRETEVQVLDAVCDYLSDRAACLGWDCKFTVSAYEPYIC